MFDRLEEARFRLERCVVMLGDEPVYVEEVYSQDENADDHEPVDPNTIMAQVKTGSVSRRTVPVSDLSWDFPPLGWAPNSSFYFGRRSVRQYRFGLTRDNMQAVQATERGIASYHFFPDDLDRPVQDLLSGKPHCQNYEEALDKLNERLPATLSPTYLLQGDNFGALNLFRHQDIIAKSMNGRKFYIKEELMHYCDEFLEQAQDDGVFFEAV